MNSTLKHTSSRQLDAALAVARIAASQRVRAERLAREAQAAAERARQDTIFDEARRDGQYLEPHGFDAFCFICSRATDHWGEHTPEQIAAWRARQA